MLITKETPLLVQEISALANEAMDLIMAVPPGQDAFEEARDLFVSYANLISSLGGGFVWRLDEYGQEIWTVHFPKGESSEVTFTEVH